MAPNTQTRNSYSLATKITLSLLGVVLLLTITFPTELLTTACTWIHPLQDDFRLTLWSFRGAGDAKFGSVNDEKKNRKVELEIHIMSQCPDAKDCMEDLVFPALEQLGPDIVDFKMSFIGKTQLRNGGVACLHGPSECLGDMIHICGAKLYPYNSTVENHNATFIPFSTCLIHDYQNLPNKTFIEGCAKEGKVDFEKINQCVSDPGFEGGVELLRSSFDWSEYLGVRTSCTVRLGGKRRCVRDGGKWTDCEGGSTVEDLVRDVKAAYKDEEDFEETYRQWLEQLEH